MLVSRMATGTSLCTARGLLGSGSNGFRLSWGFRVHNPDPGGAHTLSQPSPPASEGFKFVLEWPGIHGTPSVAVRATGRPKLCESCPFLFCICMLWTFLFPYWHMDVAQRSGAGPSAATYL